MTTSDSPSTILKRKIEQGFSKCKDAVCSKNNNCKALLDFLSSAPYILTKSNTHFRIQSRFIKTGMIDASAKLCPNF